MFCKIKPAFFSVDVGDVRCPYLVRRGNRELLVEKIIRHRERMARIDGSLEFPFLDAPDAQLPAYLPYPADPRLYPVGFQNLLQPLRTTSLPGHLVGRLYLNLKPGVLHGSLRGAAPLTCVIPGGRYVKKPA